MIVVGLVALALGAAIGWLLGSRGGEQGKATAEALRLQLDGVREERDAARAEVERASREREGLASELAAARSAESIRAEKHAEQIAQLVEIQVIPEEDPAEVEAALRRTIEQAAASFQPPRGGRAVQVDVKRILLARALKPLPGNKPLVEAIQKHGQAVFGEPIPAVGTPLYTDVRLYGEHGIPGVIYGAGPRTVRESNAKRADEHLDLQDLRRATKVVARTLLDLLTPACPTA